MTRTFYTALMATGLVGVLSVGTAHAQITDPVVFTTSFPFTIGNQTVPAGRYEIRRAEEMNNEVLELSGLRNHLAVFFETIGTTPPGGTASASEIVFKKYGDTYVLKDIWESGDNTGAETVSTRREAREAKNGPATEHRVAAISLKGKTTS